MSKRSKWGGHASRNARSRCRPLLGGPCPRCGKPVVPRPWLDADGWHPDHWPVPLEQGGTQVVPAHAECNTRAGGKRGAQITNARRAEARALRQPSTSDRARNIRGI